MKHSMNMDVARWVVFALLALFLVSLVLPYFTYGEAGESASLMSYLAFPYNYGELEGWIGTQVEGYGINDLANTHVGLFCLVIVAGVLLAAIGTNVITLGVAGGIGIWGVVAYASNKILALGGWARTLQMTLLLAAALVAVAAIVSWALSRRGERESTASPAEQSHAMAS